MLLDYLLIQKRRIEYMGSAVRNASNTRSNINSVSNSGVQETYMQAMIRDIQNNQTNMERQLLNVTKAMNDLSVNKRYTNDSSSQSSYRYWLHESNTHETQNYYQFRSLSD